MTTIDESRLSDCLGTAQPPSIDVMLAAYHYAVDDRDGVALDQILAEDATFELPGGLILEGAAAIRDLLVDSALRDRRPPLSHHLTNVVVLRASESQAWVRSKYLAVRPDGSLLSGVYDDQLQQTPSGWVIQKRQIRRLAASGI